MFLQELGFKVNVVSVSEPSAACRAMIAANHQNIPFVFDDLQMQREAAARQSSSNLKGPRMTGADFAITGTMCTPYSKQRGKRFLPGSVREHEHDSLTSVHCLAWVQQLAPLAGVVENVEGWNMPESFVASVSPMSRPTIRAV